MILWLFRIWRWLLLLLILTGILFFDMSIKTRPDIDGTIIINFLNFILNLYTWYLFILYQASTFTKLVLFIFRTFQLQYLFLLFILTVLICVWSRMNCLLFGFFICQDLTWISDLLINMLVNWMNLDVIDHVFFVLY